MKLGKLFKLLLLGCVMNMAVMRGHSFDPRLVEMVVTEALPGNTRLKPSLFNVGILQSWGIRTLEVSICNNSQEQLVLTPDVFQEVACLQKNAVTDVVWRYPRRVNTGAMILSMAGFGYLGIRKLHTLYWQYYLKNKAGKSAAFGGDPTISPAAWYGVFGLSLVALGWSLIFPQIEHAFWREVCRTCLFDAVTLSPGQAVTRYVFVDANVPLPDVLKGKVLDASGFEHTIDHVIRK